MCNAPNYVKTSALSTSSHLIFQPEVVGTQYDAFDSPSLSRLREVDVENETEIEMS